MYIKKYNSSLKKEWNDFVKKSKNTHFFFQRDYMEYHANQFIDYSLMVYDDKDKLVALLPANIKEDIVYSHGGLTFGGFLVDDRMTTEKMLEVFAITKNFLSDNSIIKLVYKCIPHIYHTHSAEEDRYALFINNANLIRRDVSSTILLQRKLSYSKGRKWMINKAKKENVHIEQSKDIEAFWRLLIQILQQHHQANPVHSVEEIQKLVNYFSENIKLFIATKDGQLIAGALIYENENTIHTQYLANSEEGRAIGALDLLIHNLITEVYKDKQYLDFGISNENQGRFLNVGLIAQKEGFGARAVVHDFYEMDI